MEKETTHQDAIELLEADHKKVKALFKEFEECQESGGDREGCRRLVEEALQELRVHAAVEEEIFYPAAAGVLSSEDDLVEEAKEEHHVVKTLIAELEDMDGDEDNFRAKFMVLAENVRHHIKEEEGGMFPQVKKSELNLDALGRKMAARKEILETDGLPVGAGVPTAPTLSAQNAGRHTAAKRKRA